MVAALPRIRLTRNRLCTLLLLLTVSLSAGAQDRASLAWSAPVKGVPNIFYSRLDGDSWSSPVQISDASEAAQLLPTLAEGAGGVVWVVWTELGPGGGKLRYNYRFNGEWIGVRPIDSTHSFDTAATLAIDGEGVTWLAWAGTRDGDDEIFVARWSGLGWTRPVQVNIDDEYPDVLPNLAIDAEGRAVVNWFGYDGDRYVEYSSTWTADGWSAESTSGEGVESENTRVSAHARLFRDRLDAATVALPPFLKDPTQASIQFEGEGGPLTLRLYDLK